MKLFTHFLNTMKKMLRGNMKSTFLILILLFGLGCQQNKPKNNPNMLSGELIIFHAGSLSVPFKEAADSFQKEYPDVEVKLEAAGSVDCARKITELNRQCDIMASADYKVIDKLLIPEYTGWLIPFAANEMVLVYHEQSRHVERVSAGNWPDLLLKDGVYYGRSNPDSDPCGYRAVLTIKLAEEHYKSRGLASQLLAKDNRFIRPKETDLLALLESGALDYAFLYRSIAEQHGLPYITLPDSINLGAPDLADHYAEATVDIAGDEPGNTMTMKGEPMVYGVTMMKQAPNPEVAKAFLQFLLAREKGMAIMEKNGQPSLVPASTQFYQEIPGELREFAASK